MLQTILLVAMILISLSLTAVVLLQRSEGGALGMGGGPSGMMTARGAGNLLTTTTWWLAGLGIVCAISLTIVGNMSRGSGSIIDADAVGALAAPTTPAAEAGAEGAAAEAGATPAAPAATPSLGDLEADLASPAPATTPANPAPAN
ncbi:MAG TPA: preprotein translocase subunit SecG [Brevundimonas sp.]|jgi:preprotein translocase subunit SecG|uniref:preprotein translocase subunit SecG n=1 Tax=Brevundimonas sp. TaxID=1871086 RepID=UPI002DF3B0EE|nr:preprotein translocase subunit SecG [Brevundimonas sp.]